MHVDLTADQRLAQEVARAFVEKEIEPRAAEIDRTDEFSSDLYRQMGATRGSSRSSVSISLIWEGTSRIQRSVISRRLLG